MFIKKQVRTTAGKVSLYWDAGTSVFKLHPADVITHAALDLADARSQVAKLATVPGGIRRARGLDSNAPQGGDQGRQ
jgi:hypothetical protein